MKTKISLFITLATIITLHMQAQNRRPAPDSAAAKAFRSLQKNINEGNFKLFGLTSAAEAANLRLGPTPIDVYLIRLDSVQKFQGGPATSILTNSSQVVYPLYSGENIVSSVKLDYDGKSWAVESFGDRDLITFYQRAQANTPQSNKKFLIRIPALNVYFSAYDNNGTTVQLLGNQQMGDLKPGTVTTLPDALLKLKTLANAYNGLPW
ncbi:MAG: hypothetical protein JST68_26115 [Bacteroidetes bacterium]|nr:hypothetical protein [Bacteroidota bacterium]